MKLSRAHLCPNCDEVVAPDKHGLCPHCSSSALARIEPMLNRTGQFEPPVLCGIDREMLRDMGIEA